MPHTSRKQSNRQSNKSSDVNRVPSLYSISGNASPSKRYSRRSSGVTDEGYHNGGHEAIMMGTIDKWNSTSDVNNRRLYSPNRSVSDVDRDRPIAFVQPTIHRSPSAVDTSRRHSDQRLPVMPNEKSNHRNSTPNASEFSAYGGGATGQSSSSADRREIALEEFDNSLFILCIVSIFINPVLGPLATYCSWRAKRAFHDASWKAFRRWTAAAHAFSSIAFGVSAIAFGMIGIKVYHMYSGTQCFYKCSFLTNNEFNWQGFWDELNKNRASAANNANGAT